MWTDIPGYEGKYQAHPDGSIRSLGARARILSPVNLRGYKRVTTGKNCKQLVHRLIAITFIPNPDNKPQVNHKDGNKTNNCVDNLEWVTISQNSKHAFDSGLKKVPNNIGQNHSRAKLSDWDVRNIRLIHKTSSLTPKEIANIFGVSVDNIRQIINRKRWNHI